MATFDQLPQEQQAVIQLVLASGRSYDELADMLGVTPSRVRELAREALTELAPVTASRVDPEWRGQLVDYVLNQQSGAESTATEGHLKRSEPARVWTYSLLDSLDDLYANGTRPSIPGFEDGAGAARPRRERERPRERERRPLREVVPARAKEPERKPLRRPTGEPLSEEAQAVVRRRRIVGAGIGGVLLIGIVFGILALAGAFDSGGGGKKKSTSSANQAVRVVGELVLNGQNGTKNKGIAVIAQRGSQRQLIIQATLPQSSRNQAYIVWLFNTPKDAVSVGAQAADKQNRFQGAGPLPANYQRYKYIDVTQQTITSNTNTAYGGKLMLRGTIANLVTPQQAQQGAQGQGGAGTQGGTGTQGGAGTGTTP